MKKYIIALIIVVLVLIAGYFYWQQNKSVITDPGQVACTMEARICPDGVTYVGRQGPKCEFQACPASTVVSKPVAQVVKDSFFWINQPFLKSDSISVNNRFFNAGFVGFDSGPNPYGHGDSSGGPTDIVVSWGDGSPVEHNCKDLNLGHIYSKIGTYKVKVKAVTLKSCDDPSSVSSVLDEKEYTAIVSNWISGWKTYRSDIHNLEFKYPANWKVSENENGLRLRLENPDRVDSLSPEGLAIFPIASDEFIRTCVTGGNYERVSFDSSSPSKGKDVLDSGWRNLESTTDRRRTLCFNGAMIEISYVTTSGQKTFDQILSTFKFI